MSRCAGTLPLLALLASCATPIWKRAPHDEVFQREPAPRLHTIPKERDLSLWWDTLWTAGLRPPVELFTPERHLRRLSGGEPALDVNAFGQVPDSTWFVNRIGRVPLPAAEVRRGPNTLGGPAPGPLEVLAGIKLGLEPRLLVRDSRRERWVIKLEHPALPEMGSGAEMISTRLLHAAGYYLPDAYLVRFERSRLRLAGGAVARDRYGLKIRFMAREWRALLETLGPGTVRALFSRFLPGRPIGPFASLGVRPDDPNDTIPHERRRSLRGLWLFAAWINHSDMKRQNTLDTFITVDSRRGLGYVLHYLLDVGSTLGSGETLPKLPDTGHVHFLDYFSLLAHLSRGGGYQPVWEGVRRSPYRAIGIFDAEPFEPADWRPVYPYPIFEAATDEDTYWAAAILSRFTPELIAAAVETAEWSEPGAAQWMTRALLGRQRKLLRYAFSRVLALDDLRLVDGYRLQLTDLEAAAGLIDARQARYQWVARWSRTAHRDRALGRGSVPIPVVDLKTIVTALRGESGTHLGGDPFLTVTLARDHPAGSRPPLEVRLRVLARGLLPVGLQR